MEGCGSSDDALSLLSAYRGSGVFRVPGSGGEVEGDCERFLFNSANDSRWYIVQSVQSNDNITLKHTKLRPVKFLIVLW